MRAFAKLLLVLLLAGPLAGCSSRVKMDLELYPGAGFAGSDGNIETADGTLFRIKQISSDGTKTVNQFFRTQLVDGKGWSEQGEGRYTDGNIKVDLTYYEFRETDAPTDPSKPAGMVAIYQDRSGTAIKIWRYVPKWKK